MKKVNHILLLFSLLVFAGSEALAYHPDHKLLSTSENRAEPEAQPSTSIFASVLRSIEKKGTDTPVKPVSIGRFTASLQLILDTEHIEIKKLFLVHRQFLI